MAKFLLFMIIIVFISHAAARVETPAEIGIGPDLHDSNAEPVVEFDVTFNVEATSSGWGKYNRLIKSLRTKLGQKFSHNLPVLPPQTVPPTTWFEIILVTKKNEIKLRLRRDNLYLDGYMMKNKKWYEFGVSKSPNPPQLIPGSSFLGFGGAYNDLSRASGKSREEINLGQKQLAKAVDSLSEETKTVGEKAEALTVVIQMTSESIRFSNITNFLTSTYPNGGIPPGYVFAFENNWGDLSRRLLLADSQPGGYFKIDIPNDMDVNTSEQAVSSLGILLAPRASRRRRTLFPLISMVGNGNQNTLARDMLEVFSVTLKTLKIGDTAHIWGDISVNFGLGPEKIYHREKGDAETIKVGRNLLLTGPKKSISALDSFSIELKLMNEDVVLAEGLFSWNVYDDNPYDTLQAEEFTGDGGSVMVNYIVLSDAVAATVKVLLLKGAEEDPGNVYGRIDLGSNPGNIESTPQEYSTVLFLKTSNQRHMIGVLPRRTVLSDEGEKFIPLTRSLVAVPLDMEDGEEASLVIRAELYDSSNNEIVSESVEFPTKSEGESSKRITGEGGEIEVRVSFSVY